VTSVRSFAASDPGTVRTANQDRLVDAPERGLWAVADGAGGHAGGELAAGMLAAALAEVPDGLQPDETLAHIRHTVTAVHAALQEAAAQRGTGMIASTLAVLLLRGGHFAVLWAGDSRAYLLRGGVLTQITRDHSLVQALLDRGAIAPHEAPSHPHANVITRAIGADDDSGELDKALGPVLGGDCFLLCSDGLTKALDDAAIAALLTAAEPAAALLAAALAAGARDNVTAVVVRVADAAG
jgi:serine/threonine protein phosphatase PrpC